MLLNDIKKVNDDFFPVYTERCLLRPTNPLMLQPSRTTRSFPGFLGSLQGFFKAVAVIGGHIRKGRWGYGQRGAQGVC